MDLWAKGDYPTIARHLLPIAEAAVEAARIAAGERVLDVGVGDGNAAVLAARRGALVTGVDITPAQVERARQRCAAEGVDVDLRVGDAQALDVPDGAFDVAVSVMAMIFAPDPVRAAAEAVRVVRPGGGRLVLTSWRVGGWSERWRGRLAELLPGPLPVSPTEAWGEPGMVQRRFAGAGLAVEVEEVPFEWAFPSVDDAVATMLTSSPPHVSALEQAAAIGKEAALRAAFVDVIEGSNAAVDGTCRLPAPFLLAVGCR